MSEYDVHNRTADQLLDYLASDGSGEQWMLFADLVEWELLYNFKHESNFIGKQARNLVARKLAVIRRSQF